MHVVGTHCKMWVVIDISWCGNPADNRRLISRINYWPTLMGFAAILMADMLLVMLVLGIGPLKYTALSSAPALTPCYLGSSVMKDGALTDPSAASRCVSRRLSHHHREVFSCLYLDNQHRIIFVRAVFRNNWWCKYLLEKGHQTVAALKSDIDNFQP